MISLESCHIIHEAMGEAVEAGKVGDDGVSVERWIEAANLALAADDMEERASDKAEAIKILQALEKNLADENRYLEIAALLFGNVRFDSRPQCVKDVFEAVINNHKLIILGASSTSKCLGPDVPVMMFDGSIKPAKEVKGGDVLMGDDGTPRNVLGAHGGYGPMFRITPERGESWTCNDQHILSLKVSSTKICGGSGLPSRGRVKGQIKDMSVLDYINTSNSYKDVLKLFHVGVDFPAVPLEVDPYIYGAWIGDGCTTMPMLHTPRGPMSERWCEYWNNYPGMKAVSMNQKLGKCASWRASKNTTAKGPNCFSEFIKKSVINGDKFIRKEYLINSRENRLKLLAGLLDSDGWLDSRSRSNYGFVSKYKSLAGQVTWLARSLGFSSTTWPVVHTIKSIGFSAVYWHSRVSGRGVSQIPCLEKPANESKSQKNMTSTGFKVEPIGDGPYNGFLIDGNHRFLLGDFTVTHNTYSCGVLFYLYWRNDPYFTQVILAGPSEDHLYGNLFSHIVGIHKSAAIPLTDDDAKNIDINETDMFIAIHDALPEMRIRCVLCKQNQVSATGLRGHKPKPVRTVPHPKLGMFSRVYELIDEGTHVSPGAFEDIKTTEACINPDTDTVKIVIACNPEGVTYKVVELAEPEGGWDAEQVDTLYRWTSAKGYPVLRLDGKRCENVVQRRVIYEGLITYEAFLDFLKSGENSGPYWAKGRGFPPLKDNAWTIIPPAWMNSQRGEPIYVGVVKNIGAEDTALGGGDKALWGVGRWGEAAGWRKNNGETEWFVNRANPDQRITKYVMVLDQIFHLPKSDNTVIVIQELMGRAKQMEIPPENVAMDKGGNAAGVWSHAKQYWGDVLGIDSGERASEDKVLSDDLMVAYDIYEKTATELWFATKRWLDPVVCAVLINPIVPTSPLFNEMTTRRYRNVKAGKVQVEPKHEWRARNGGVSPDTADVLNLMVAWCRHRGGVTPGIMEEKKPDDGTESVSIKNADEPDTLETNASWTSNRLSDPE